MLLAEKHAVTERTAASGRSHRIDRNAGIIYGVKVCGNKSKNGRVYPSHVLEAAAHVYEGVAVYLDHGQMPGDERPLEAHFGNLRRVRMENGELYADLHYLKSHAAAEAVLERAERFANNFGLSHDAEIYSNMDAGVQRVTKIMSVASVDLVTHPATNEGIFESEGHGGSGPLPSWRVTEAVSNNYTAACTQEEFRDRCFHGIYSPPAQSHAFESEGHTAKDHDDFRFRCFDF
ncbi:hypothetical protein AB1K70_19185 [Bremerella sp. JC770]|uniref:hypothetical protein n=1 Tax=Bremerella sp. JC770 TaxID=3232137 RepID=UPI00345A0058